MGSSSSHDERRGNYPSTVRTLIHPLIAKIGEALRTGTLTPDQMQKPATLNWTPAVPGELLPFLESPNLDKLAEVLKNHPSLYWHPLVMRQVRYLARLHYDEREWHRLGWNREYDKGLDFDRAPKELAHVTKHLQKLLDAHAAGLFPGWRIKWAVLPQKSGPKAGLKNPHPIGAWAEWVSPEWLADDFRALRSALGARLKTQTGKPHLKTAVKEWYRKMAQEVFEEGAESEGVAWWSNWREYKVVERSVEPFEPRPLRVGDTPPDPAVSNLLKTYDAATAKWTRHRTIDARTAEEAEELMRFLDEPITSDVVVRWKPLDLDKALSAMLSGDTPQKSRAIREGLPAYLAYAILGALLNVKPDEIRDSIENYIHPRRRRRSK